MIWRKPGEFKQYTDLCKWCDAWFPKVATDPVKYEKEANLCYNYLWLLANAIARRRHYFSFEEYDGFSFYAASRVYWAIMKSYENNGKKVKGKIRTPIKSCKNYMVAIFGPMRMCYRDESYNKIISEEWTSKKFDALKFRNQMMEAARVSSEALFKCKISVHSTVNHCEGLLDKVLSTTWFKPGTQDYLNLKTTMWLNLNKLLNTNSKLSVPNGFVLTYWKLPKSMGGYIKTLLNDFFDLLRQELIECYGELYVDESLLSKMISSPNGEFNEENCYTD